MSDKEFPGATGVDQAALSRFPKPGYWADKTPEILSTSRYYSVEIFFSREDNAYIAIAPDLPGCSSLGDSRIGAARSIGYAIRAWIAAAKKAGNPIPEPREKA
jgi:predicted RNase H-like HicB family nuclease